LVSTSVISASFPSRTRDLARLSLSSIAPQNRRVDSAGP
jgi:hypothetical protein